MKEKMSLQRKKIRDEWVETIRAAKTLAGRNIVANRANKNWHEDLPAVNIYPESEISGEIFENAPIRMKRTLQIAIECIVQGKNEKVAADELDLLMDQIEQAILYRISFDEEFRCIMDQVDLAGIELEFTETGKNVIAAGRLEWTVRYFTDVRDGIRLNNDLDKANVGYSVGDDSENEVDQFSVPTT